MAVLDATLLYLGGKQGLITLEEVVKFSPKIQIVLSDAKDEKNVKIYEYAAKRNLKVYFRGQGDPAKLDAQKYRRLISSSFPFKIFPEECENVNGHCLNIHSAILPKYRGAHSGTWALINGEHASGVTLHKISDKFDAGEILSIEKFDILDSMWIEDINLQLENKLRVTIEKIFNDSLSSVIMPSGQNIYWRKRSMLDSQINWHLTAQKLFYLIRALARDPIWAFTRYNNNMYKMLRVNYTNHQVAEVKLPGEVIIIDGSPFIVCGDHKLLEVLAYDRSGVMLREGMVLH